VAENIVSRDRMEKEVWQRERHQEAFRRERQRAVAYLPESIIAEVVQRSETAQYAMMIKLADGR
jgi:hypothetical protein